MATSVISSVSMTVSFRSIQLVSPSLKRSCAISAGRRETEECLKDPLPPPTPKKNACISNLSLAAGIIIISVVVWGFTHFTVLCETWYWVWGRFTLIGFTHPTSSTFYQNQILRPFFCGHNTTSETKIRALTSSVRHVWSLLSELPMHWWSLAFPLTF